MFFKKKRTSFQRSSPSSLKVFVRHAIHSDISANKKRPQGFSRKICYENLMDTIDSKACVTFFLDMAKEGDHFLKGKAIEINEGTEAGSFLRMLEYVEKLSLDPNTIIYFLEDDYLHRPGWVDILFEGFSFNVDYVTLYDHQDKYKIYPKLRSKIMVSKSCHWRTTPSTTNTYAMRFGTLLEDIEIHRRFSQGRKVSADHEKFCFLGRMGAELISPIPGWSTHVDPEFISPCIDWEPFLYKELLCNNYLR